MLGALEKSGFDSKCNRKSLEKVNKKIVMGSDSYLLPGNKNESSSDLPTPKIWDFHPSYGKMKDFITNSTFFHDSPLYATWVKIALLPKYLKILMLNLISWYFVVIKSEFSFNNNSIFCASNLNFISRLFLGFIIYFPN